MTSNFGSFKIEFETSPSGNDHISLPATLNPVTNIKLVEVRDAQTASYWLIHSARLSRAAECQSRKKRALHPTDRRKAKRALKSNPSARSLALREINYNQAQSAKLSPMA